MDVFAGKACASLLIALIVFIVFGKQINYYCRLDLFFVGNSGKSIRTINISIWDVYEVIKMLLASFCAKKKGKSQSVKSFYLFIVSIEILNNNKTLKLCIC